MGLLIQKPKRNGPGTPTSSSTQVGISIARHNLLGKKFDTGYRKQFGNLHAFPTSEILRTKYDREITTEKEAKSKQSNEHFCIESFHKLDQCRFSTFTKTAS